MWVCGLVCVFSEHVVMAVFCVGVWFGVCIQGACSCGSVLCWCVVWCVYSVSMQLWECFVWVCGLVCVFSEHVVIMVFCVGVWFCVCISERVIMGVFCVGVCIQWACSYGSVLCGCVCIQ